MRTRWVLGFQNLAPALNPSSCGVQDHDLRPFAFVGEIGHVASPADL